MRKRWFETRHKVLLAPVVAFLLVLIPINLIVPKEWLWVVYLVQICNIASAAGDVFIAIKFSKMPKDILVRDSGVGMAVYSRRESDKNGDNV